MVHVFGVECFCSLVWRGFIGWRCCYLGCI